MSWWKKQRDVEQMGAALYRGRWVARAEDFRFLESSGIHVGQPSKLNGPGWSLELHHEKWGKATLLFDPELPVPPPFIIEMDPRLNDDEKADIAACRFVIGLSTEARTGNLLADRKDLLRFLHALLGKDGVAAMDHSARAFWSRAGLEAELEHDAELDIDAIYSMHLLCEPSDSPRSSEQKPSYWLHSHGLSELGFWDFDILDPAPSLHGQAHELVRALAFSIVEGQLVPGGDAFMLSDRDEVRAVPAEEFLARAPKSAHPDYRSAVDETHLHGHAVLCDPSRSGWLSGMLGKSPPRASKFFQGPFRDPFLLRYSRTATDLMARRARDTLSVFRNLVPELAEFKFPALAKLGYPVDGGQANEREHLWFEVHQVDGDSLDATLVNSPFYVSRLKANDRGRHSLELLSDWTIHTPFGQINPRQTRTLRFVRDNRERIREIISKASGDQPR